MVASRLRREVIAPDGPDRRDAVAAYRRRRTAIERAVRFRNDAHATACAGRDVDPGYLMDVVDELDRLIKALRETL